MRLELINSVRLCIPAAEIMVSSRHEPHRSWAIEKALRKQGRQIKQHSPIVPLASDESIRFIAQIISQDTVAAVSGQLSAASLGSILRNRPC